MSCSAHFTRQAALALYIGLFSIPVPATLTVTKTQDLSFGSLVLGSGYGTVTISTAGGRTSSGLILITQGVGANGSRAVFSVTGGVGSADCTFNVTPSSLYLSAPNMSVGSFVTTPANGSIRLNVSGGGTIYVGGTLNATTPQSAGSYSNPSSLSVTVTCL